MRVNSYFLLLLTTIIYASSANAQSPVGRYIQSDNSHHLDLKADGTFIYEYRTDTFIDLTSDGTWELKDKKVILNSYMEVIHPEVEFERVSTPGSKRNRHLNIELISDKYNEDDFFIIPVNKRITVPDYSAGTRGSHFMETAFLIDSMAFIIVKDPVDNPRPRPKEYFHKQAASPKYEVLQTEMVSMMLHPGESANVTIYVYNEDFEYKTFENFPVAISKKGLLYKDEGDGKTYELERKK